MATEEKPSRNEEEYFARQDAELMKARRAELDESRRARERQAHYMKCPKCGADLQEKEFQNVRVDVCPECKGTWLDAGELEMIAYVRGNAMSRFIGDMIHNLHFK